MPSINSLIVTIPATVIPITLAAFAAYGFAWIKFRGRSFLFAMVVGLLVVPLQMSLVPLLRIYRPPNSPVSFLGIWLAHTGFGLPLAVYPALQLHLPAAQGHLRVGLHRRGHAFHRLHPPRPPSLVPSPRLLRHLPVPVGLERLPGGAGVPGNEPGCRRADHPGCASGRKPRGEAFHLLTAAAFVSMLVPLIVFLSLQRFFVRGLLAGSVKG